MKITFLLYSNITVVLFYSLYSHFQKFIYEELFKEHENSFFAIFNRYNFSIILWKVFLFNYDMEIDFLTIFSYKNCCYIQKIYYLMGIEIAFFAIFW